jgi:hypothetical protein
MHLVLSDLSILQSLFEVFDYLDGLFALILLQNRDFLLLVDGFDGFLDLIVEVEVKSLKGVLNVCNFITSEVDKIAIVCFHDLHFVEIDLVVHEEEEMIGEVSDIFGGEQQLGVGQDNEVIRSRIFVSLEIVIEVLPLVFVQQTHEESSGYADKLLMRVVGGPFVLAPPLVDLLDFLLRGLTLEVESDVPA